MNKNQKMAFPIILYLVLIVIGWLYTEVAGRMMRPGQLVVSFAVFAVGGVIIVLLSNISSSMQEIADALYELLEKDRRNREDDQ